MSLRAYDDLALNAGLAGDISSVLPSNSFVAKIIASSSSSMTNKSVAQMIIAGTIIFYLALFFVILPFLLDSIEFLMFPLFCLGPFLVGGIVIAGYNLLLSTLMGKSEILMSAVLLRRGDALIIHYSQPIKRSVTFKSIAFSLVLQESATYDQGSSTATVTHDHVIDQTLDADVQLSPETGINRQLTFTIPDNAMHSFEAYRNRLDWYVKVKFDIPNFPDYHKVYKIKVLAEVNHES